PAEEITRLVDPNVTHPMEAKKALGRDIVSFYHGENAARSAQEEWVNRIPGGGDPTEIPEVAIPAAQLRDGTLGVTRLLVLLGMARSNSAARRAVEGGGVTVGPDKTRVTDPKGNLTVTDSLVVRIGKRQVVRVRLRG